MIKNLYVSKIYMPSLSLDLSGFNEGNPSLFSSNISFPRLLTKKASFVLFENYVFTFSSFKNI